MKLLILWFLNHSSSLSSTNYCPVVHLVPSGNQRQFDGQRRMVGGRLLLQLGEAVGGRAVPAGPASRRSKACQLLEHMAFLCAPKSGPCPEGVQTCVCLLEAHSGFLEGNVVVQE